MSPARIFKDSEEMYRRSLRDLQTDYLDSYLLHGVGGDKGIGMMIQQANGYYQMDVMLMGIILLGIIGICFEKIVKFLERRFTGWQETIQQ